MDLSSNYDLPNPYGLLAADFNHDMDGYRACLGFLGDLATGSEHAEALEDNGGNQGMLVGWRRSAKFRRVYEKCKKAGEAEREYAAEKAAEEAEAEADWESEGGALDPEPQEAVTIGSFHLRLRPPSNNLSNDL